MKPFLCWAAFAFAMLILFSETKGALFGAAFPVETESDLEARIPREHNLIKKAKFEIRLAHLKLLRGEPACEQDNHEVCHQMLGAYLGWVRASWKDLQASGKFAVKHPAGFKEVDIALREDARNLRDSEHRIPYEDRDYIESVRSEINALHEKVLGALFPGESPRAKESKSVPAAKPAPTPEAHFAPGGAR